jgi:Mycothiol maleylpyruvate isomerase N-terminal domain
VRHRKADVVDRTRKEFQALDRLVKKLRPSDWRRRVPRPESKDHWTVKDALAHIVHWKQHTARVFRGEKGPAELRGLEVNAINRIIYDRWRKRGPAKVLAWHRQVQLEVMRTLDATPPEYFSRREHGADWPGDFTSHSAWHRVRDIAASIRH